MDGIVTSCEISASLSRKLLCGENLSSFIFFPPREIELLFLSHLAKWIWGEGSEVQLMVPAMCH